MQCRACTAASRAATTGTLGCRTSRNRPAAPSPDANGGRRDGKVGGSSGSLSCEQLFFWGAPRDDDVSVVHKTQNFLSRLNQINSSVQEDLKNGNDKLLIFSLTGNEWLVAYGSVS